MEGATITSTVLCSGWHGENVEEFGFVSEKDVIWSVGRKGSGLAIGDSAGVPDLRFGNMVGVCTAEEASGIYISLESGPQTA